MTTTQRRLRWAGSISLGLGLLALLYVGIVVVETQAETAAPLVAVDHRRQFVAGERLGRLRIERLGLEAAIREGERASELRRGVGHLSDTPWIGQGGNVALAGHRDTVFRALRKIQSGDVIEVATASQSVRYRVEKTTVVRPDDLSVLEPSPASTLTLITCYPFSFIGAAPNRFVVRAREIRQ